MSDVVDWEDLEFLFGPPPVLSTEGVESYEQILAGLVASHKPRDVMEKMLVRQMVDATWDIFRFARHKNWTVDRRFREDLSYRAREARSRAQAAEGAEHSQLTQEDEMEIDQLLVLARAFEKDGNAAVDQMAKELDHAQALEEGMDHYERLDKLHGTAWKRFHDAFRLLQQYREVTR